MNALGGAVADNARTKQEYSDVTSKLDCRYFVFSGTCIMLGTAIRCVLGYLHCVRYSRQVCSQVLTLC